MIGFNPSTYEEKKDAVKQTQLQVCYLELCWRVALCGCKENNIHRRMLEYHNPGTDVFLTQVAIEKALADGAVVLALQRLKAAQKELKRLERIEIGVVEQAAKRRRVGI